MKKRQSVKLTKQKYLFAAKSQSMRNGDAESELEEVRQSMLSRKSSFSKNEDLPRLQGDYDAAMSIRRGDGSADNLRRRISADGEEDGVRLKTSSRDSIDIPYSPYTPERARATTGRIHDLTMGGVFKETGDYTLELPSERRMTNKTSARNSIDVPHDRAEFSRSSLDDSRDYSRDYSRDSGGSQEEYAFRSLDYEQMDFDIVDQLLENAGSQRTQVYADSQTASISKGTHRSHSRAGLTLEVPSDDGTYEAHTDMTPELSPSRETLLFCFKDAGTASGGNGGEDATLGSRKNGNGDDGDDGEVGMDPNDVEIQTDMYTTASMSSQPGMSVSAAVGHDADPDADPAVGSLVDDKIDVPTQAMATPEPDPTTQESHSDVDDDGLYGTPRDGCVATHECTQAQTESDTNADSDAATCLCGAAIATLDCPLEADVSPAQDCLGTSSVGTDTEESPHSKVACETRRGGVEEATQTSFDAADATLAHGRDGAAGAEGAAGAAASLSERELKWQQNQRTMANYVAALRKASHKSVPLSEGTCICTYTCVLSCHRYNSV
jgi:hypothetical protein